MDTRGKKLTKCENSERNIQQKERNKGKKGPTKERDITTRVTDGEGESTVEERKGGEVLQGLRTKDKRKQGNFVSHVILS